MMDNISMSEYVSFKDVVDGKVDLGKYTAIWWHFHADNGDNPPLPDDAKAAVEKFKVYYQNGGNLLLTRYATFYIKDLSIAKDETKTHPKLRLLRGASRLPVANRIRCSRI